MHSSTKHLLRWTPFSSLRRLLRLRLQSSRLKLIHSGSIQHKPLLLWFKITQHRRSCSVPHPYTMHKIIPPPSITVILSTVPVPVATSQPLPPPYFVSIHPETHWYEENVKSRQGKEWRNVYLRGGVLPQILFQSTLDWRWKENQRGGSFALITGIIFSSNFFIFFYFGVFSTTYGECSLCDNNVCEFCYVLVAQRNWEINSITHQRSWDDYDVQQSSKNHFG